MLKQELHDLAAVAELFPGDALCFATVTCLAAHLPFFLRSLALDRAREAILRLGLAVSQTLASVNSEEGVETHNSNETSDAEEGAEGVTPEGGHEGANATPRTSARRSTGTPFPPATSTATLTLGRFHLAHFAPGVLTNVAQLQGWAYPSGSSAVEEFVDDSADESEGFGEAGGGRGGEIASGENSACLPFHPAFMDAAVLALSTPKWPLIIDPEGVALR